MPDVRRVIDILIRAKDEGVGIAADQAGASINKMAVIVGALAGAAVGLAVGLRQMTAELATLERRAKAFGVTTDELQRLDFASKRFGGDSDVLFSILQRLEAKAQDLAGPLAVLGIHYEELKKQDPTSQVLALARGFQSVEDHAIRSQVAVALFGGRSKDALALLETQYAELQKTIRNAPVIDKDTIEAAAQFDQTAQSIGPRLKAWAVNTADISKETRELVDALEKLFGVTHRLDFSLLNPRRVMGARPPTGTSPPAPFQLPGTLEMVPGLGMIPTERTNAAQAIDQDVQDLIKAITRRINAQGLIGPSQIGPAGLRVSSGARGVFGARPSLDTIQPVGDVGISGFEEEQNRRNEQAVAHLIDLRDQYDALRDGLNAVEVQGESLGATLVDGAFQWGDAWARSLALVQTQQAKFSEVAKSLFRGMVTDMLTWINKLIIRQLIAAALTAIFDPTAGSRMATVIAQIGGASAAASGGAGGGDSGSRSFAPRAFSGAVDMTGYGRPVVVQAQISSVFGSQGEMRAAAAQLKRVMEAA